MSNGPRILLLEDNDQGGAVLTLADLVASQEPYVPPAEFYTRLAQDTRAILFELGPHTKDERRELIETLRWAEKRKLSPEW
jgi:hypothetical protein